MTEYRKRSEAGFYRPTQQAKKEQQQPAAAADLDDLTRVELLERAQQMGLDVDARTKKDDLRTAIEEADG